MDFAGGTMSWGERIDEAVDRLTRAQWVPQLLMRLFVGYFFLESGWGKIHSLDSFTERFTDWGIPAPAFNAALSGWTEFLGGLFIVLGLFTRLVSIPMLINMVVATLLVKLKKVSGLDDFVELDEPLYALSFLWLFFSGPGWVSLDHLLGKVLRRKYLKAPA
jgi:putative oxidoreductase